MLGRVKLITPNGYGFIVDEEGKEYFFHFEFYSGNWDHLRKISPPSTNQGPVLQFQVEEHYKGLRAKEVQLIGDL